MFELADAKGRRSIRPIVLAANAPTAQGQYVLVI